MPEEAKIANCDSGAENLGGWGLGRSETGGFAGGASIRVRVCFGLFRVREKLVSSL